MVLLDDASYLRRGMQVAWEWGDGVSAREAQHAGIRPSGTILSQADIGSLEGRFALRVDDRPGWIIDPVEAISRGRKLYLVRAAELPEVLNAKQAGRHRANSIYIGRPSEWGNPFSIGKHGDRDAVLEKYIQWLHESPEFVLKVRKTLAGKDLICWCAPEQCHGHILRDIASGSNVPEIPQRLQPDLFPD